ncbi:MAG: alpha/beta hydrolase [Myxococcales bacterium]|nr:alpha/beta hydrolase [Myxococcales bacterium]MCB9646249.1 alpha/beta hydrolase [Deltaproteobacteria bacterium]
MRCTRLSPVIAALALTACIPSFSQKGPMPFSEYPYTSVEGQPWTEGDLVLDEITQRFDLGVPARVHYVELNPEGRKTVIFVHGLGSYLKFWRYQLDAFAAEGYRVLALDMLGYGKSAKPATFPYTMVAMAEVVRAFAKAQGVERPVLVGHSMGGQTSLSYAITWPDEVEALVLTAPAGFEKFSPAEREWFRSVFSVALVKSVPEAGLWGSIRRNNFYRWSNDYAWLVEERARVIGTDEFDAYAYAQVKSVQGLTNTEFTRGNLGRVKAPTLIIFGNKDRLIPNRFMHPGHTRGVMAYGHDGIQGSKMVELKGCGHTVQMDCWKDYNREVLGFLGGTVTATTGSSASTPDVE